MLSVSIGPDGWTTVTPGAADHVIYVSSSTGSDANDGSSPSAPVASLGRGISLLRNGTGDQLLLKCGDTWNGGLGTWRLSGQSADNPMVVGSYGSGPRPLLDTGTSSGLWAASISSSEIDHLDILGIHFNADGRDPNSPTYAGPTNTTGIEVLTRTDGITIEDCQIENYAVNINLQSFYGPISNAVVRRNVIDDAYATTSHSQGLYCYGVNNLLIEGNTFDANGFNSQVAGAVPTYYNHDCYLASNNTGVTIDNNIFARAAGFGLQARSGGNIQDNVFIDNPVAMSFGLVNGATSTPGGVTGIINGNIFIGGGDQNGAPFGQGLVIGNTATGYPTIVSNNIFADSLPHAPAAITLSYGYAQANPQDSVGLNDLNVEGNVIYNWYRGIDLAGAFTAPGTGITALSNVNIRRNVFQAVSGAVVQSSGPMDASQLHWLDNTYPTDAAPQLVGSASLSISAWSAKDESGAAQAAVGYVDATRSLANYDAALGGTGDNADFLMLTRQQSQQTWQDALSAGAFIGYMRGGFDVAAAPHDWTAPTPPMVSAVDLPATVMARSTAMMFSVSYLGHQAIQTSTLSSDNLTVSAKGYSTPAQFVSYSGSGNEVTAMYQFTPPKGMFAMGRRYKFTVSVNDGQVMDAEGFPTPAGAVETGKVRVLPRPAAPRVRRIAPAPGNTAVAVTFSSNVSASLLPTDLLLTSSGGQSIDPSTLSLSWDASQNTATWTLTTGSLTAGVWTATLDGSAIVDTLGQPLAGSARGKFVVR